VAAARRALVQRGRYRQGDVGQAEPAGVHVDRQRGELAAARAGEVGPVQEPQLLDLRDRGRAGGAAGPGNGHLREPGLVRYGQAAAVLVFGLW
jgi:hypothetical protein